MNDLMQYYKDKLKFEDFYKRVRACSLLASDGDPACSAEYIANERLLMGVTLLHSDKKPTNISKISALQKPYIRVDVPVWFGDLEKATTKIIVYGSEPRETNECFNVEVIGDKVFAAPFGIDRWNSNSSVQLKPQNKYFRAFGQLISNDSVFVLFSDVVKEYGVHAGTEQGSDDAAARKFFHSRAVQNAGMTAFEIDVVKPDIVIGLGSAVSKALKKMGVSGLETVRHPSHGGEKDASEKIRELLEKRGLLMS